MACLVSILATVLVVMGIKESKIVMDIFTWMKVLLVLFMTLGGKLLRSTFVLHVDCSLTSTCVYSKGYMLFNADNLTPLFPPEFGASGVLHGAMSSFFGYLGFDAVCCVAGEAINAERNLPLSIMITLGIVTSLYIAASVALVGMQHYTEISPESGYPEAFHARGVEWAAQLTAVSCMLCIFICIFLDYLVLLLVQSVK